MSRWWAILWTLTLLWLSPSMLPQALAQEPKEGAILLMPESDMDKELSEDLTEVLIGSLVDKSGKGYKIMGKEVFRKALADFKMPNVQDCLADHECIRTVAKSRGLQLVVVGKVGKAMGGFRLEVHKLSTTGTPDRQPFRKRVSGDLDTLIAEVERLADWVLQPDHPYLKFEILPAGAKVLLDNAPVTDPAQPVRVTPGTHQVQVSLEGHATVSTSVTCEVESLCVVKLDLKKTDKPVEVPIEPKKEVRMENPHRYMPWVWVFGGVAVAATGGGVIAYLDMLSIQDDINAYKDNHCPGNKCDVTRAQFKDSVDPMVESGNSSAVWASILVGAAVLSAGGAVTMLVLDLTDDPVAMEVEPDDKGSEPDPAEGTVSFAPLLSPQSLGAFLQWTF